MDVNDYSSYQNPDSNYLEDQNPASPYDKGSKPLAQTAQAAQPKPKTPTNGEVTILTSYPWDPAISGKTEIDYVNNKTWHPGYPDYSEITGVKMASTPGDFVALMGMIAEYDKGSIKRLNFFTHANKTMIGITGHLDANDVYFDTSVTQKEIANYAANGLSFTYNKQNFTLDDVRARFASDATFVLYGCDAGFDPTTLLTALKDLFQVNVVGFKEKTVYCLPEQPPGGTDLLRKGEKIGINKTNWNCGTDSTTDWRSLINDPNAVTVKK